MADPQDILDIPGLAPQVENGACSRLIAEAGGVRAARADSAGAGGVTGRPWLGIWFRCCHTYGRMYRDMAGLAYTGRCPRCGSEVRARVGTGGTSRRLFETT